MVDLVSLGELMLRLSPPKFERLRGARSLDVRPCGAQFNMAANLASLGKKTLFLSFLPDNELGRLARSLASEYGIDLSLCRLVDHSKIGMVFVEFSAAPRRMVHIYDRTGSAASAISAQDFSWQEVLSSARFAYVDGIFLGLNDSTRDATLAFAKAAKAVGCRLCFDVNFRPSLWPSPAQALEHYQRVLPFVDILVTNRSVSEEVFGYRGRDEELLRAYHRDFSCSYTCLTYRTTEGLTKGSWRSLAYHSNEMIEGQPFDFDVVDPFGTGDAFFAGLIYALSEERSVKEALDFGSALCALAHTIEGDVAVVSPGEVDALLSENYTLTTKR
jgi:2-dehydro-3-deoxygluconokinase